MEDAIPDSVLEQTIELDSMLGIDNFATYDISSAWSPRSSRDFLNVPFAVGPEGETVRLDIKESAQGGMGPHGLCVGATGSGNPEYGFGVRWPHGNYYNAARSNLRSYLA